LAMTSINSIHLNATWYVKEINFITLAHFTI